MLEPLSRQQHFLSLLNPCHDRFTRYVRAMARNTEDARDVIGETLLIAFEHLDELRKQDSFLFYLIAIARREYLKMTRRRLLFIGYAPRHEDLLIDMNAAPDTYPDVAILYAAIARLPLRLREALVLFELSGLSLEEIRVLQGGSLSGVKSRVARSRKKLAAMLGERESTSDRSRIEQQDANSATSVQECES
ncbi:MAG: RNA polymerase sigma factor [Ignavibacteria bacterium]|nr:RNA polymerase sigma factor [Ignavibacteria bacterium]